MLSLRLPTSFAVIFGAFTLGFYVAIQGPTLMDLIDLLHVNNDIMSYSLAFASLAYSVGGLLSGFLFNYVNRQILIACFFTIFGLANIATPFISNYYIFSVITVFKMMCAGGTDCGANVWILELWPGKDSWLQALHFSFAIGCALGPLIVEPFLSVDYKETDMDKKLGTNGQAIINDQAGESRIYIPYGVSGSSSICAAALILWLYFLDVKQKKQQASNLHAKQQAASGEHILMTTTQHPAVLEAGGLEAVQMAAAAAAAAASAAANALPSMGAGATSGAHPNAPVTTTTASTTAAQVSISVPVEQRQNVAATTTTTTTAAPNATASVSPPSSTTPTTTPALSSPETHPESASSAAVSPLKEQPPPTPTPPLPASSSSRPQTPQSASQLQVAIQPKSQQKPRQQLVLNQPQPQTQTQPQAQAQQQPQKITSKAREQLVGRPPYYVMFAIALAALCLSFYCGIEITSMNYLATFAVNIDLQLPKSTAALMSSALTISFAVGRAFGIWIAAYVKPHKLFYLCAGIMALGNVFMLVFANTAETLLWCSICLFGVGCGPMFPAIVSFYDDKISKVTNTVSGIFILGSMFNVALNSLIIGHYIIDNALILIVCNLVGSVLLMLLFGTLHMLTKVKKNQRVRKYKLQQQKGANILLQQQQSLIQPQPSSQPQQLQQQQQQLQQQPQEEEEE